MSGMQRRPEAGATKLPPLDVCLSAMDERIEYLSSALSSLSEELGGKRASLVSNGGGGGGGGAELAAVKLKLAEAEAKVAAGGGGGGGPELAALKAENADLKLQVKEKDEVIASLSDELDSTAAAAFAASASLGAPPQMPVVNAPVAKGKKSVKKGGGRRLSLASSMRAVGNEKSARIERMVELLTNIPTAQDPEELVEVLLHGAFALLQPDVSEVSVYISAFNKTYTCVDLKQTTTTAENMTSHFMKTCAENPDNKLSVSQSDYKFFLGDKAHASDVPQAVMCLPIFDTQRLLAGVLEVRNQGQKQFVEADEEQLAAITAQCGVQFTNLLYNSRLSQALQSYEFSQFDMKTLIIQVGESASALFEADLAVLAVIDEMNKVFTVSFERGGEKWNKTVPMGDGPLSTVYRSRIALSLSTLVGNESYAQLKEHLDLQTDACALNLFPIDSDGKVVGVFGVVQGLDCGKTGDAALMKMFSSQIGVMLKNCELYQSAVKGQESILNKLELLDVAKSFATELDHHNLMMTIIEKTRTVMNADRCALFILDAANDQLWSELADGSTIRCGRAEGIVGWVASHNQTLSIPDAYSDSRFNPDVDKGTGYHTHSILATPVLNAQNELTGVIQMVNKKGGPFTGDDEELLLMIASQAGVTLTNAQMYDEVKKDQENFNVLLDISKQLSSELDTDVLISTIVGSAKKLLDCDRASLFLVDKKQQQLYTKIADGLGALKEIRMPINAGIAGSCANDNLIINIPDCYADSRFNRSFDAKTGYTTRNMLVVPVNNSKGEVLGVTQMMNKNGGPFTKGDESLLSAFTSQAAVSIENAQLFKDTIESRNLMQSVLKSIKNLVMAFNDSGGLITVNHGLDRYFGVNEAQIGQLHYRKWLMDHQVLVQDMDSVMKGGAPVVDGGPIEVEGVNEGESRTLSYSVAPLVKDGEAVGSGCVLVFDDLTEKKMMKATLGRYLSGALVNQVLSGGANALGGVRQKVSILFSDIRSFTTISESMDAVDLVQMLNGYFGGQITPIFDNKGVLDKFIGDAIMAVFGVPFVSPDDGKSDTINSAKCAMEMIRALDDFNAPRIETGEQTLKIGVGINTANVVSGNIGSEKRMEYTVIGDGVNLASRLEGITKTYACDIIISEFTMVDIESHFITRELDTVAVKGKDAGVKIFELVAARDETVFEDGADLRVTAETYPMLPKMQQFSEALELYRTQKFSDAIPVFEELANDPAIKDFTSNLYVDRCKEYLLDPPPTNWDGVYRPKSK